MTYGLHQSFGSPPGVAMTLERPTDWLPNPPQKPEQTTRDGELSWLPEATDWTPGSSPRSTPRSTPRSIRPTLQTKQTRIPRRAPRPVESVPALLQAPALPQRRMRKILTTVLPFSTFVAAGLTAAWILRGGQRNWTWWFGVFGAGLAIATTVRWVANLGEPRSKGPHESPTSTLDGAVAGMACALFLVVGFLLLPQSFEDRNGPKLVDDPTASAAPVRTIRTVEDNATTKPGVLVEIPVLNNDTGLFDRTTLIVPVSTLGAEVTSNFAIAYTPAAKATGVISFAYRVCNTAHTECSQSVIHVDVKG